jgi:hypothetical protein
MTTLVRSWNSQTIRQREDGYVCLTDMAKSTGKKFSHWNQLDSSKNYLNVLSSVTGIPATGLVQVFQGGLPESQGTWGHPKVSLRFAQWCSEEFAVQVDIWVDELLTKGTVSLQPQNQPQYSESLMRVAPAFRNMLTGFGVHDGIASQAVLKALERKCPELSPFVQEATQLLGVVDQEQNNWLNPTDLADLINQKTGKSVDARKVNQILLNEGYQFKTKAGKWSLTDKGKTLGTKIPFGADHGKHNGFQVKWKEETLDLLISYI